MALTPGDPFTGNLTAKIDASGLAKDTTVQAVHTALGSPAQDATVTAVKTTLGSPAQDATVTAVKTTLGSPAQDATVTSVKTTLGSPAQDATVTSVKTTLGSPAQDASVTGLPTGIFNTGVPIYSKSQRFWNNSGAGVNIASVSSRLFGPFALVQPGYDIHIELQENTAGNSGVVQFDFQWIESLSGLIVEEYSYYLVPGSNGGPQVFAGSGPTRGDTLQVNVFNNNTAAVNVKVVAVQNSRFYDTPRLYTDSVGAFSSYIVANIDVPGGIVGAAAPSVVAAGTVNRLIGLYNGPVSIHLSPGNQPFHVWINQLNPFGTAYQQVWAAQLAANGDGIWTGVFLSKSQCFISFNNTGSATASCGISITKE